MKVTMWGTRGSIAAPGPDTVRYGGNTSCVSVEGDEGTLLVLDAGTGIRGLGGQLSPDIQRVNILLTHLHMDHLQGLPFFAPMRRRGVEIHIYGPMGTTTHLSARLQRYLSPPLFPVSVRDLACEMIFHEVPSGPIEIDEFRITPQLVIHPNPTVGYRIQDEGAVMTYLPDHEPMLGARTFPTKGEWTSGFDLCAGVDLLIHDTQYTVEEYANRVGFGHSSIDKAMEFAGLAAVQSFVPFHHDPTHNDEQLDQMIENAIDSVQPDFTVQPGKEGAVFNIGENRGE